MRSFLFVVAVVATLDVYGQTCGNNINTDVCAGGIYRRIDADGALLVASLVEPAEVVVLDISDPSRPTEIGKFSGPFQTSTVNDVAITGTTMLVTSAQTLYVVSIADPRNPTLQGTFRTVGFYTLVTADGRYAVARNPELQRLEVLDLIDPTMPTLVGTYPSNSGQSFATDIALAGTALHATNSNSIEVISIANPTAPVRVRQITYIPEIIYTHAATTREVFASYDSFNRQISLAEPDTLAPKAGFPMADRETRDITIAACTVFALTTRGLESLNIAGCANIACAACIPGPNTTCLANGRFKVEAAWVAHDATTGLGTVTPLTPNSSAFWFFDPTNVELVTKVLDACAYNGRFWFFAGGLTDVGVQLTVTDTQTGRQRTYTNTRGTTFRTITDTDAFATCTP